MSKLQEKDFSHQCHIFNVDINNIYLPKHGIPKCAAVVDKIKLSDQLILRKTTKLYCETFIIRVSTKHDSLHNIQYMIQPFDIPSHVYKFKI